MPLESLGVDVKMTSVDMDPKTYSPMSGSDENMSSPPSVLTTASAGSCTPSSLPSAGSTPSSIPSAGSTPYQFVSQEESTIIKPLTPLDHQSVHPATPDQPITPEPAVTSDLHSNELTDLSNCKKNLISGMGPSSCVISSNNENSTISDDVNERRDDCTCIMCDDKQTSHATSVKEKENQVIKTVDLKTKNKKVKSPKLPKVKDGDKRTWKKNRQNKNIQYESEISDPQSASIKIKIKVTKPNPPPPPLPPPSVATPLPSADDLSLSSLSILPNYLSSVSLHGKKHSKSKRSGKRKSSEISETPQKVCSSDGTKRKKSKVKLCDQTFRWGPILPDVNGEAQSGWGYDIPVHILEKIFLLATYSQGCIPFLLRMSRVCRLWHDVSSHPQLWHSIDLSMSIIKPRFKNEKKLLWLIENRLTKVEDLNLSGWTEAISPIMLRRISEHCPNLRSLNVSRCYKLHAENIHSLLFSSLKLNRLDLSNVMGTHKPTPRCAVGQQTLADLASSLNTNLTHLIIANNTVSNVPSIISSLAEYCDNLQVLDLSSVETIGRDSVRLDIEKLQRGCPRLRILRLTNSLFRLCQTPISVQVNSPGFPKLEELSVAVDGVDNIGVNDVELERILKNSIKLRLLDVRGCHNVTDSSLVRIPPWDLEHLFLAGGSHPKSYSDRLELVIRKWQHSLVELDLSWTSNSDAIDAALMALSEEENVRLQILDLRGSSMNFKPIRRILDRCVNLQRLNLTSCRALPRGVKRLYDNALEIHQLKSFIDLGKYDETGADA